MGRPRCGGGAVTPPHCPLILTPHLVQATEHLAPDTEVHNLCPRDSPPFHQPALTPTIHYLTPNFHPTPTMHHSASATQPASSTTHHLHTIHEPATAVHHPALTNRAGPGAIRRPTATHPSCIRLFIANTHTDQASTHCEDAHRSNIHSPATHRPPTRHSLMV